MTGRADLCDTDDRTLMARVGCGSHDAFQTLMHRHMAFVLGLAQRLVGQRADADEIAQEAFLRVWTTAPSWRPDGAAQFRTWLYRVVVNLCLDRRRRDAPLPLDAADETHDPNAAGLETVARSETALLLAQALDTLPPRQKAALVLFYYAEVSGAEAARILNVSESALESLLVRGRKALRRRMDAITREQNGMLASTEMVEFVGERRAGATGDESGAGAPRL